MEIRYLVCRYELIREWDKNGHVIPKRYISSSDHWPMIVTADSADTEQEVLNAALDSVNPGYRPKYTYLIVPLTEANLVGYAPPKPVDEFHSVPFSKTRI